MKLIDCFMYFDEDLILDIRLNILNEVVDKFVIVESTLDHAGNKKKLNFKKNYFSKFEKKIEYIVADDLPDQVGYFKKNWSKDWHRENYQRNKLALGYKNDSDNDLIMISDIDEIPNPKKIKNFRLENKYACFIQMNFQSKINLLNFTDPRWAGTKICKKKHLKSPQWLRNIKTKKVPFWKFYKPKQPQIILDGGWHFSFLKTPDNIAKKINSYAHQEYNKENYKNFDNIKKRIENNIDLFERGFTYKPIEVDNRFPDYIKNNIDKFKDWII